MSWQSLLMICVLTGLFFEGWLLLNVLRQNGRLLRRIEGLEAQFSGAILPQSEISVPSIPARGLPIGALAPAFDLPDRSGKRVTLESLLAAGRPCAVIFSDVGCPACADLTSSLSEWQRSFGDALTFAVISRNLAGEKSAARPGKQFTPTLLQQDETVSRAYGCVQVPAAVLVDSHGLIASPLAVGPKAIKAMVEDGFGSQSAIGRAVPEFAISDSDGRVRELTEFRGRSTLLLFWNSTCIYCLQMEAEVMDWTNEDDRPQLVVIAEGVTEHNARMSKRFPLLLDSNLEVRRFFGVSGTPSAILLDSNGNVASRVAVGAAAVMALRNRHTLSPTFM